MLDAIKSPNDVKDCNFVGAVDFVAVERLSNYCRKEETKVAIFEELENEQRGLEIANLAWLGKKQPFRTNKQIKSLGLSNREVKPSILSIESPLILELNFLPSHLKYIYLGDHNTLPIIILSYLNTK